VIPQSNAPPQEPSSDGWLSQVGVKQLEEDTPAPAAVQQQQDAQPEPETANQKSQDELNSKPKQPRKKVLSFLKKKEPKEDTEDPSSTPKADRKTNRFSSFFGNKEKSSQPNIVEISGPVLTGPPPTMGGFALPVSQNGPVFPTPLISQQTPPPPPQSLHEPKIERLHSTKTFKHDILKRMETLESQVKELKELVDKLVAEKENAASKVQIP
jgi:outer membrane murein-binding lipoprotein Lpp